MILTLSIHGHLQLLGEKCFNKFVMSQAVGVNVQKVNLEKKHEYEEQTNKRDQAHKLANMPIVYSLSFAFPRNLPGFHLSASSPHTSLSLHNDLIKRCYQSRR